MSVADFVRVCAFSPLLYGTSTESAVVAPFRPVACLTHWRGTFYFAVCLGLFCTKAVCLHNALAGHFSFRIIAVVPAGVLIMSPITYLDGYQVYLVRQALLANTRALQQPVVCIRTYVVCTCVRCRIRDCHIRGRLSHKTFADTGPRYLRPSALYAHPTWARHRPMHIRYRSCHVVPCGWWSCRVDSGRAVSIQVVPCRSRSCRVDPGRAVWVVVLGGGSCGGGGGCVGW